MKFSVFLFLLFNDSVRPLSYEPIFTQFDYERAEVSFSILQVTLPWQPISWAKSTSNPHTFDLSSRAVREISAYDEKCKHRPINSVLLIGLRVQLLHAAGKQIPDSMDADEPINWQIDTN